MRRQNECQSVPRSVLPNRVFADDEGMTDQSTLDRARRTFSSESRGNGSSSSRQGSSVTDPLVPRQETLRGDITDPGGSFRGDLIGPIERVMAVFAAIVDTEGADLFSLGFDVGGGGI